MSEDVLEFIVNNHRLFGIRSFISDRAKLAVIFLPAGLKYHVGPHRLHVKLSRSIINENICTYRIDPYEIGESDGLLGANKVQDIWRDIEEGKFVADVVSMIQQIKQQDGIDKVVLFGICGGAVTAEYVAEKIHIDGIIAINTACLLSSSIKLNKQITNRQMNNIYHNYFKRVFSVDGWMRFFSGKSDYSALIQVAKKLKDRLLSSGDEEAVTGVNVKYLKLLEKSNDKKIPHLFIFGERDGRWMEFQDIALKKVFNNKLSNEHYTIQLIKDANHEFHLIEWQDKTVEMINGFLNNEVCDV